MQAGRESGASNKDDGLFGKHTKKVIVAAGSTLVIGGAYLLYARSRAIPTQAELSSLLIPVNEYNVEQISIMRRLAKACNNKVNKMMDMMTKTAMELSTGKVGDVFSPAKLPEGAQCSFVATNADNTANIALDGKLASSVYEFVRAERIKTFLNENILPLFTKFVGILQGLGDKEIFNVMGYTDVTNCQNSAADVVETIKTGAETITSAPKPF